MPQKGKMTKKRKGIPYKINPPGCLICSLKIGDLVS